MRGDDSQGTTLRDRPAAGELARGAAVGRYVIVGLLGRGGMGEVYTAHDPELGRDIALKLVRPDEKSGSRDHGRARLLREARAVARLTHPNVVAVHDAGTHGDEVFIAMELVEGPSLRTWLSQPRSRREIIDVMLQAGRGLAASHAAGLVHRDFKPANVLVGKDGRVRVTDFGLAQLTGAAEAGSGGAPADSASLTATGLVVGTPSYMAPEQVRGEHLDGRTDQWAFAVTLHEALFGERPFRGDSRVPLEEQILAGATRPPPAGREAPAWLRRILARALSPDPERRYPSIDALLTDLAHDRRAARRNLQLGAAAVAVAIAVAAGAATGVGRRRPLCTALGTPLERVWNDAARRRLRDGFLATGKPYAGAAWASLEKRVDQLGGSWVAMRRDACEATHVRGEQSAEMLDRRMGCLDEHLGELAALLALYERPDAELVAGAAGAAQALGGLEACADRPGLLSRSRPRTDPVARARGDLLGGLVAAARALEQVGRFRPARDVARAAAAEAVAQHDRAQEGAARLIAGRAREKLGEFAAAEEDLEGALRAAEGGHDDRTVAEAWTALVFVTGFRLRRPEEASRYARFAEAAIERLGGDELLDAFLAAQRGVVLRVQGKPREAIAELQRALAVETRLLGPDDLRVAGTLSNLGILLGDQNVLDEALAVQQRALTVFERALGPDHPTLARSALGVGRILERLGRYAESEAASRRGLSILERAGEGGNFLAAQLLASIGQIMRVEGRTPEAVAAYQRAIEIQERNGGTSSAELGYILDGLAAVLIEQLRWQEAGAVLDRASSIFEGLGHKEGAATVLMLRSQVDAKQGRHDEALAAVTRARAIFEAVYGADHPMVGEALLYAGIVHQEMRRWSDAERETRLALGVMERALGPESADLTGCLGQLGGVLAAQGRHAEALAVRRRALAVAEKALLPAQPGLVADLADVADSLLALGRGPEARAVLERAVALGTATRAAGLPRAEALLARARRRGQP